jgi:hypothetical protein
MRFRDWRNRLLTDIVLNFMTRIFIQQIRNNPVAINSLVVAVSSLSYNAWRNESI